MNSIKTIFFTFVFLVSFLLFSNKDLQAQQNPTFERAFQDYVFASDNYSETEDNFQLKRSEYLKFGTLSSKEKAEGATKEFLMARDEVVMNYFTAIRSKLAETKGISDDRRNDQYSKIDAEVLWHQDHKKKVEDAKTLDVFVELSKLAATRFEDGEIIAYYTLNLISEGKVSELNSDTKNLVDSANSIVGMIDEGGDKNTEIAKRWIGDADNQINKSSQNIETSNELLTKLRQSLRSSLKRSKFNQAQASMYSAFGNTKEAIRFLGEIVAEIKTAD